MLNTQLKATTLNKISRTNILSSGFTLIELLVVIVILAILAVAVIVAINPAQRIADANNSKAESDLSSFGSSAAQYAAQNGYYPTNFNAAGGVTGAVGPIWSVTSTGSYTYTSSSTTSSTGAAATACPTTGTTSCSYIAITAPAVADASLTPAVVAGTWCFRSVTGTVTNIATAATIQCVP